MDALCKQCADSADYPSECLAPLVPVAVNEDEGETICGCPQRHVPLTMLQFVKQLDYETRFGATTNYCARSNKFIEAFEEYQYVLAECRKEKKDIPESGMTKRL